MNNKNFNGPPSVESLFKKLNQLIHKRKFSDIFEALDSILQYIDLGNKNSSQALNIGV